MEKLKEIYKMGKQRTLDSLIKFLAVGAFTFGSSLYSPPSALAGGSYSIHIVGATNGEVSLKGHNLVYTGKDYEGEDFSISEEFGTSPDSTVVKMKLVSGPTLCIQYENSFVSYEIYSAAYYPNKGKPFVMAAFAEGKDSRCSN